MKRILITLLTLLIGFPVVLGAILGLTYQFTGSSSVPSPQVGLLEQQVEPVGYNWHSPVFAGMLYKDFEKNGGDAVQVGELNEPTLEINAPNGYVNSVALTLDGKAKWEGLAEELNTYDFIDNGTYLLEMTSSKPSKQGSGYGNLVYRMSFTVQVEPRVEASVEQVRQGDVLALRVFNLTGRTEITAETTLGQAAFTESGDGKMTAYIPISYSITPAQYNITVRAGEEYTWRVPVTVIVGEYDEKDVETDYSLGEAIGYNALYEKSAVLEPLYEEADDRQYWSGAFQMPTSGNVVTRYGAYLYENEWSLPGRSEGIDIQATEGSAVLAPASGRVVYAGSLMNTGNTIVIEHGGGLKSYLFHLDSIEVSEGQMVEKGADIGTVGSTGAVTEPTLTYELRIGARPINPQLPIDGTGGLFHFPEE